MLLGSVMIISDLLSCFNCVANLQFMRCDKLTLLWNVNTVIVFGDYSITSVFSSGLLGLNNTKLMEEV